MTDQDLAKLARKTLSQFNTPKAYRDLPTSQVALTLITLPTGKIIKASGFAHERHVATMVRKHLGDIATVTTRHVIVARADDAEIETRATFMDLESGISRRAI